MTSDILKTSIETFVLVTLSWLYIKNLSIETALNDIKIALQRSYLLGNDRYIDLTLCFFGGHTFTFILWVDTHFFLGPTI